MTSVEIPGSFFVSIMNIIMLISAFLISAILFWAMRRTRELFKRADTALYNTKENGRNGVTFYNKNLVEKTE